MRLSTLYHIFHQSCYGLSPLADSSIDALVTDPPYGIAFQNHEWDKALPQRQIWEDSFRVLKSGAFGLVFSSVRLMHHLMLDLESSGFIIKDVLFWVYLNGMPKSRDVALAIDKELGIESKVVGKYTYIQGYKKGGADSSTLKPVALMQHLVKLVSFEDQTVLDPFMGSGSTGIASLQLNRKFVGFELEKEYFEISERRIKAVGV